ncbi:RDD family protein [Rhizomonospora bruguierae]|uniref:RDD family protein n=1 Tax=Rhizomonospora bruguierae TaxID=1581705 RepID=UPI001BCAF84E|nr:RDD family protein [Micromonospora sp. NBRC 107566]
MVEQRVSAVPASLGRRFAALLIDWLLSLLAANIFADPVRDGWSPVVVLIGMYAVFVGLFAQTPGMLLLRLHCVDHTGPAGPATSGENPGAGGRIGLWRGLIRGVLLCLVIPPLIMDAERRGLHDRAVNSIVVHTPRG